MFGVEFLSTIFKNPDISIFWQNCCTPKNTNKQVSYYTPTYPGIGHLSIMATPLCPQGAHFGEVRFNYVLIYWNKCPTPPKSNTRVRFVVVCFYLKLNTVLRFCFQLEYGADPSLSDNDGYTAVHLAAKEGHDGVLEKLLSTGYPFIWVIYLFTPTSLVFSFYNAPCISLSRGPFLESLEKLSHLESRSKISNLMITEVFYSEIYF